MDGQGRCLVKTKDWRKNTRLNGATVRKIMRNAKRHHYHTITPKCPTHFTSILMLNLVLFISLLPKSLLTPVWSSPSFVIQDQYFIIIWYIYCLVLFLFATGKCDLVFILLPLNYFINMISYSSIQVVATPRAVFRLNSVFFSNLCIEE